MVNFIGICWAIWATSLSHSIYLLTARSFWRKYPDHLLQNPPTRELLTHWEVGQRHSCPDPSHRENCKVLLLLATHEPLERSCIGASSPAPLLQLTFPGPVKGQCQYGQLASCQHGHQALSTSVRLTDSGAGGGGVCQWGGAWTLFRTSSLIGFPWRETIPALFY